VEKPLWRLAADRTARVTYMAQACEVADPAVPADKGRVPELEILIKIREGVFYMYTRSYQQQER
jgi:hypothetical protein